MAKKVVPSNQEEKPSGRSIAKENSEADPDDLVHSPDYDAGTSQNEDPDDLVHNVKRKHDTEISGMEDPDDLVHDDPVDDDDR